MIFKSSQMKANQDKVSSERIKLNDNKSANSHLKGLNSFILRESESININTEKEFNENYYGFQVYLPQPMLMSVPMSFPNFAISPHPTPFTLHSCIEEDKEAKVFQITRKVSNYREKSSEIMSIPRDKFVAFSYFEINNMAKHLHKPIENLHEGSTLAMNHNESPQDELNRRSYDEQGNHQIIQKFKEDETKCMYNVIYGIVLPKWENYLRLKSERSVETQVKARQDTLWKKIFRDVREFFRILFRLRFHYLEFKDSKGAAICIQKFFDELGIPITEKEACDNKLFRFVHQTHKIKSSDSNEIEHSSFESIEKFNEIYKRCFMTNFTCARMFCFVFQSFLKEYSVHIKSRHKKDVLTMICMALNCYKRMSSCHHIKRICGCIIRYDITQKTFITINKICFLLN